MTVTPGYAHRAGYGAAWQRRSAKQEVPHVPTLQELRDAYSAAQAIMPRQARLNAVLDELGISFRRFGIHSNMETPPGLFGPLSSGDFDQFMQKIDLATVMYEDREWLLLDGNRYGQIIALKERLNTTVN